MKNLDRYLSDLMIGNIKLHNLHWNVTGLSTLRLRQSSTRRSMSSTCATLL